MGTRYATLEAGRYTFRIWNLYCEFELSSGVDEKLKSLPHFDGQCDLSSLAFTDRARRCTRSSLLFSAHQ